MNCCGRRLEDRGHSVQGVQFNAKPLLVHPADVNIFDEVVNPAGLQSGSGAVGDAASGVVVCRVGYPSVG